MKKLLMVLSFVLIIYVSLFSLPKILVDCVHGFDHVEQLQSDNPNFEFIRLDQDDFQIENILIEGTLPNPDSTFSQDFYVPENTENLYMITDDYSFAYDYFIYLINPDGNYVRPFQGILELENPQSGNWQIFYNHFQGIYPEINFTIGTGPHFLENIDVWEYDAFYRLWNDVWTFFIGPIQEYTESEEQVIQEWIDTGLGFMTLYNCKFDGVLKPVVRLYDQNEPVDVKISFDGFPTYQSPKPQIDYQPDISSYLWSNVSSQSEYSEILYEIGKPDPPHFLDYNLIGNLIETENQSPYPVYGLYCLKSNHDNTYEIAVYDQIDPDQKIQMYSHTISRYDLMEMLKHDLPSCMIERGLPSNQAEEFFLKYNWVEYLFSLLSHSNDFLAIFLIDDQAYNGIFPLELSRTPSKIIRQLWIVDQSISFTSKKPFLELPSQRSALDENGFSFYEYGFYPIDHNREVSAIFDLTIHNDDYIIDPTNYEILPEAPIFHVFGNNEIASYLSCGGWVEEVYNYHAPFIDFSEEWSPILLGDNDCYTHYGVTGDLCCLVGKEENQGRILVGGTSHLIGFDYILFPLNTNYLFRNSCFSWITFRDQVIEVPQDYTTINEAIDAAEDGDIIVVDDGTYNESINFEGKNICIESKYGPENCFLELSTGESIITFENYETNQAKLMDFTITGAGSSAIMIDGASPIIGNNVITDNVMQEYYLKGAAINCRYSSALIYNNIISHNSGAYYGGGINLEFWDGEMNDNEIFDNTTASGYGIDQGAGIYLYNSIGIVNNNLIYENATDFCAAAVETDSSSTLFTNNENEYRI